MTNVTCGLTAKKPGSAPSPTLVIEFGTILLLLMRRQGSKENFRKAVVTKFYQDINLIKLV